jgi:hypothetical protein
MKNLHLLCHLKYRVESCQTFIQSIGHTACKSDTTLLTYQNGSRCAHILLCDDDILLTASTTAFLREIIAALHKEFSMTDLAPCTISGLFQLNQTPPAC